MSRKPTRPIAEPFVVARPDGRRIRTRIVVSEAEHDLLWRAGTHLGRLAGADLAERCRLGDGDGGKDPTDRRRRKQALTAQSSSRWAGAITRTSNDQWARERANLEATRERLAAAAGHIRARAAVKTFDTFDAEGWQVWRWLRAEARRNGVKPSAKGYRSLAERHQKLRRLAVLEGRIAEIDRRLETAKLSVVRGGTRLARTRHHLDAAGMTETEWRQRWEAERLFLTADGEKDKLYGNETIRLAPDGQLSIRLPTPLAHLANARHGRYMFASPVRFAYRADEWDAQVRGGAVRYDIAYDTAKGRWYLDASWTFDVDDPPAVADVCAAGVLGVDANDGFVACWHCDPSGNPVADPHTIGTVERDAPSGRRDGQLRATVTQILDLAERCGVRAVAIENLNFADAASRDGRHRRGRRGQRMRRTLAGFPTGQFRDRLVAMAANRGIWVVAVDPAYTSRWGAQHWQKPLATKHRKVSRHDAAAVVIARRALGHGARRRPGKPCSAPEDAARRTTGQAERQPRTREGNRNGQGNAPPKATRPARQPADQEPQHRSAAPTEQDSLLLTV